MSLSATTAREHFFRSFFAFSSAAAVAASCSSAGRAAIAAVSFLFSLILASKTLWGLPMCEQRMTIAPASRRNLMVGSASTIRLSEVITPSFTGTLKSHRTRHFFPATSMSRTVFLLYVIFLSTFQANFYIYIIAPSPILVNHFPERKSSDIRYRMAVLACCEIRKHCACIFAGTL